jgi:uncharacterized protein YndB with AHSA1/START domain
MADRTVAHATFVIERTFDASPDRVYSAWADPAAKAHWFGPPEGNTGLELDFRVGGRERNSGAAEEGGEVYTYDALYMDIVPGQRIVYTYEMYKEKERISVSQGTVEFAPSGGGTRMTYTDQGAYLDGADTPEMREHGTRELFDALEKHLQREPTRA